MKPQRLAVTGAIATLAIGSIYLTAWGLLWRLLVTQPLPVTLNVMPVSAIVCGVIACGLLAAARNSRYTRGFALITVALSAIVLLQYLLGLQGGLERLVYGEQTQALIGGDTPGRPAPQAALIMLFLGIALWYLGKERVNRFDFADLGIGLALFLSFMILLGHLYRARALYAGAGNTGMSLVETVLLLLLSLGALSLNPQGAVQAFTSDDGASAAKRRILPVVIATPVLLGLVQHLTVRYQVLEYSLALALSVTINIVVFLALSEWVSRVLMRIEEERTGHFKERESKAKVEGMTDTLTGLLNRRGWDRAVGASEARCQREGINACVIVIDLDGLKRINDTQGHAKGDEFIRRAASALSVAARREDTLARLGGDEFAYLSINCPPEHAGVVLKRLSQALQKAGVPASLGYAMRDLAGSIAAAFQEADHSMYAHKRARKAAGPAQQTVA
ncbi:MAG TPA: GGDEF domain-containing protein [Verrucomicrobiae bacterium]|nr:GGDEF domain-containing protein [Verrucomicrobiae bacterium]